MTVFSTDPHDAAIKLKESYRVLLTCHRNPDGDAIGSELAIAELAEKIGVEAVIVNRDATPANLMMLPGADRIMVAEALPEDFPEKYDLVITVECPQIERAGFEGLTQRPILNIDHHPDNPAYGVVNYLDDRVAGGRRNGVAAFRRNRGVAISERGDKYVHRSLHRYRRLQVLERHRTSLPRRRGDGRRGRPTAGRGELGPQQPQFGLGQTSRRVLAHSTNRLRWQAGFDLQPIRRHLSEPKRVLRTPRRPSTSRGPSPVSRRSFTSNSGSLGLYGSACVPADPSTFEKSRHPSAAEVTPMRPAAPSTVRLPRLKKRSRRRSSRLSGVRNEPSPSVSFSRSAAGLQKCRPDLARCRRHGSQGVA